MQIERLPEARLFRGVLFKDLSTALEAGRRIMTDRLQPRILRLYDPDSTTTMLKRVLGLEAEGPALSSASTAGPRSPRPRSGARWRSAPKWAAPDLGREPGEHWWQHRYDFYYPPLTLALPNCMALPTPSAPTTRSSGCTRPRSA